MKLNNNTRMRQTIFNLIALTLLLGMFLMPSTVVKADELTQGTQEVQFDAAFYASQYPDVVAAFGNDPQLLYQHYINAGKAEGRFANAQEAAAAAAAAVPSTQVVPGTTAVADGSYDILAIGNSITLHPVCGYWWGSWGMSATSADKDYIHQVQAGLAQTYSNVTLDILSVQSWEASSNRSRQLRKFDDKLANSYDLVVIQLGENVSNTSTFKKDFNNLVSYVKEAQPNAKVVVVGDYWYRSGRDAAKKDVAAKQGCAYADISAIRGDRNYRTARGTKVLGDDGKQHTVYNEAVLKHPNDLGMQYIATKVLEAIQ